MQEKNMIPKNKNETNKKTILEQFRTKRPPLTQLATAEYEKKNIPSEKIKNK